MCTGRAWPGACGRVVGGSGRVVAGPPGYVAAPTAVPRACAPSVPAPSARAAQRAPRGCIVIQPCPIPLLPSHNTPECIAIHSAPVIKPLLQYSELYCDTVLAPLKLRLAQLYCNTISSQPSLLQYNPSTLLQYKTFCCNTISTILQYNWAVAQPILHYKKIFFLFFFHLFQQLEHKKFYTPIHFFFIFHNTQINL